MAGNYYVENVLAKLAFDRTEVTVIGTNGHLMHGELIAWSDDCIVLNVDGQQQIVFTRNISTIIPERPVMLK